MITLDRNTCDKYDWYSLSEDGIYLAAVDAYLDGVTRTNSWTIYVFKEYEWVDMHVVFDDLDEAIDAMKEAYSVE